MAKRSKPKKSKAGKPPPTCKAILLCDQAIIEAGTGKTSIIGVFDRFFLQKCPGRIKEFTVFTQLVHGTGRYEITVEMQALRSDTVVARAAGIEIEFTEKLSRINLMLPMPPLEVKHSGEYEIVVFANDQEIDRQRFTVTSLEEMTDANGPE